MGEVRSHVMADAVKVTMVGAGIYLFHLFKHNLDMNTAVPVALIVSVIWIVLSSIEFHYVRRAYQFQLAEQSTKLETEKSSALEELKRSLEADLAALRQRITELENADSDIAEIVRPVISNSPVWDIREQDTRRQWSQLNTAERTLVRFVLLRGNVTAAQMFQFTHEEGLGNGTELWAWVKRKSSFLMGGIDAGFWINPELKTYLEKIIAEDKGQGTSA
jgi:hypothetical protein